MSSRGPTWDDLIAMGADGLVATMRRYLDQLTLSLATESVRSYATTLRQFTGFLSTSIHPWRGLLTSTATTSRPTNSTCCSDPSAAAPSCQS